MIKPEPTSIAGNTCTRSLPWRWLVASREQDQQRSPGNPNHRTTLVHTEVFSVIHGTVAVKPQCQHRGRLPPMRTLRCAAAHLGPGHASRTIIPGTSRSSSASLPPPGKAAPPAAPCRAPDIPPHNVRAR